MYAVIKSGGRQLTVKEGERVLIDHQRAEQGATLTFGDVLLVGGEGGTKVGTPHVAGASVTAKVLGEAKGDKIVVFKKRKRKNSKCKNGHRQQYTAVQIEKIEG